jgi:hypothetical protein
LISVKKAYIDFWKTDVKNTAKLGGEALVIDGTTGSGKKPWKKFSGNCGHCGKQGHKKESVSNSMASPSGRRAATTKTRPKRDYATGARNLGTLQSTVPRRSQLNLFFVGHLTSANDSGMAEGYGMSEAEERQGMDEAIQDFIDVEISGMSEPRRGWGFCGTWEELEASLMRTSDEDEDPDSGNDDDDEEDRKPYEVINDKDVEAELYRTYRKAWFDAADVDEPSAQKKEE